MVMANKMANVCVSITLLVCTAAQLIDDLDQRAHANPVEDCYTSELKIGKSTLATTDSYRDTDNIQLIFPEATVEYTPHFNSDKCARESKLFIPYTCFKIHSPQTWQFDEGYLSVKTLENEYTKKFYATINGYSEYNFDAFFDNNIAFWVLYLDKYLTQINNYPHILTSYIGLKWYHNTVNQTFYSLIIQLPESQRVFELMSFNKPDLSLYPNLRNNFKFKKTTVMRASFKQYPDGQYPWTGYIGMKYKLGFPVYPDIVPVKISYACSDIEEQINFYTNVMEAQLLYSETDIIDSLDSLPVSYAFLQIRSTMIEIQYIQRPIEQTYGSFTTELYKNLLVQTHNDRISGIYCGLDRWFDNHFGLDISVFFQTKDYDFTNYYYFDRVVGHLDDMNLKYRLYWTAYADESFGLKYKLYVFDSNGQSIQMIGYLLTVQLDQQPPTYNKQWCSSPCPNSEQMGIFDESKIYMDEQDDIVSQILFGDDLNGTLSGDGVTKSDTMKTVMVTEFNYKMLIMILSLVAVCCSSICYCIYKMCKWNHDYVQLPDDNNETQVLVHEKYESV